MEDVGIRDFIKIMWKDKWLIAIIMVVCIVLGIAYGFIFIKPSFEAEAVLIITPIQSSNNGKIETIPQILTFLSEEPEKSIEQYSAQIKSDDVVSVAAEALGYDSENVAILNAEKSKITVSSTIKTKLITIKYTDTDGKRAVKGANAVADAFVTHVSEAMMKHNTEAYDTILQLYNDESVNLSEDTELLKTFLADKRGVADVQLELDNYTSLIKKYVTALVDLGIEIKYSEAGLSAAEKIIEETPDNITIIKDDVLEQIPNPPYTALINQINNYKVKLSADRAKNTFYEKALEDLQNNVVELRDELNAKTTESRELYNDLNESEKTVDLYKDELEKIQARIDANIGSLSVSKMSDTLSYIKTDTSISVAIIMAVIIGFVLGVVAVFIKQAWVPEDREKRIEHPSD